MAAASGSSSDPLARYWSKRDFSITSEPRGEKGKAREWYDRTVQWMDKNQPADEELRRFRAEAAELLGIEKKQY